MCVRSWHIGTVKNTIYTFSFVSVNIVFTVFVCVASKQNRSCVFSCCRLKLRVNINNTKKLKFNKGINQKIKMSMK